MSYKTKGELEAAEKEMVEHLKLLQDELGEKAYFGGEGVGYLDVILGGFCTWFSIYQYMGSFSIFDEFPKLKAWTRRCMERRTFSEYLPDPDRLRDLVHRIRRRQMA